MIVIFQSECEGSALKKTRRVLDSFANRIGQRSWKTHITMEGLGAVKKLLNKSASKNTAVACHLIKERQRTELLWIVGSRSKFDSLGQVPVHTTKQDLLKKEDENHWYYLPSIKAIVAITALLHDWGKTSDLFQEKLKISSYKGDPLRHEWISYLLFVNLIDYFHAKDDKTWVEGILNWNFDENALIANLKHIQIHTTTSLPPIASFIGSLIISHHKLPYLPYKEALQYRAEKGTTIKEVFALINSSWGYKNSHDEDEYMLRIGKCFNYRQGILIQSNNWVKSLKKWAFKLLESIDSIEESFHKGLSLIFFQHCRLSVMLADHYFSSIPEDPKFKFFSSLLANTYRNTGKPHQLLEEHLLGVTKNALYITHLLPRFEDSLGVSKDNRTLHKASPSEYRWQDQAVAKIKINSKNQVINDSGTFIINLASTGSGKTMANAKVMQALSDDENSLRFTLALGLRSLTKQTGEEYRNRIGLDDSELAILIGGINPSELEDFDEKEVENIEDLHFEENLIDGEIDYFMEISNEQLSPVIQKSRDRKFLYAPVVVCTIDHLMSATESCRSIRNILPALRLMSSDLVIDEIDDFNPKDLIAIGRLIHLTALLGRKVMISSATIPPDLAEGYLNAYISGWKIYSQFKRINNTVSSIIIDEFSTKVFLLGINPSTPMIEEFRITYDKFIDKRISQLQNIPQKRIGKIVNCDHILMNPQDSNFDSSMENLYFETIKTSVLESHNRYHTYDASKEKSVSFGVVRMANISPCIALTKYFLNTQLPLDVDIRVMPYHSQQVMLLRHEQEKHLDLVLKRTKDKNPLHEALIKKHIDSTHSKNLIFILVTTPVEEIGRDHDFDWAVIEPSSFRSIIQLSGRVMRHRNCVIKEPNISIMQYNLKAIKDQAKLDSPCFIRPGYEESEILDSHDLNDIVEVKDLEMGINSIPRIKRGDFSKKNKSLVDLEHFVIHNTLTNYKGYGPSELQGNLTEHWYITGLPPILSPFRMSEPRLELYYIYDEERDCCFFAEKNEFGQMVNRESINSIIHDPITEDEKLRLWMKRDYYSLLEKYSDLSKLSMRILSFKFGVTTIPKREQKKIYYSDELGFDIT